MKGIGFVARSVGISALVLLASTPAFAGEKTDRARAAINQARGKVDAANKMGVSGETPRLAASAAAMLRTAEEDLARGHKEQAISEANRASELADNAIGQAQHNRLEAEREQRDHAEASAAAAHHEAAAANERAESAEQAAASAAADAAAARAAPPPAPVIVQAAAPPPPPTTTTVTTETVHHTADTRPAAAHHVARRPVRHAAVRHRTTHHAVTEKTTTTVTTH